MTASLPRCRFSWRYPVTLLPGTKNRIIDRYDREFRAEVAGQIAAALEARALVPLKSCDPRWCHCHARYEAFREAADVAREMGGAG